MLGKKIKKVIYLEGLNCQHCVKMVENILKEIDVVVRVKANLEKQECVVYLKENIEHSIMIKKIESLGFQVREIKNI